MSRLIAINITFDYNLHNQPLMESKMPAHDALIKLCIKLGYTTIDAVCHGASLRWLEACLLGEDKLFEARIKRIEQLVESDVDIAQMVDTVKKKKGKNLTQEDHQLLDLIAFCESLALYQSPDKYRELFNSENTPIQIDYISSSVFASADKIRDRDGLIQAYSESMILTHSEIEHYLNELKKILQAFGSSNDIFGFVLGNCNHTIAMAYKPGVGWGIMDINQYPAEFSKFDDALLAKKIITAFSSKIHTAFNISLITTKKCSSLPKITEWLNRLKKKHIITKEIASREDNGIGLAWLAAENGHASVIDELAMCEANLDKPNKIGLAPIHTATMTGQKSTVEALATHGADLNAPTSEGAPPVYLAAKAGHAPLIEVFARHGAELNKAHKNGFTPIITAVFEGLISTVEMLAKHKSDLDKENDKQKYNPLHIAAEKGHTAIVEILAKYKANLTKKGPDGFTAAGLAAADGHVAIIEVLAKYNKAILTEAMDDGRTLAHVAAQYGQASVLTELFRWGVDINAPLKATADKIRAFVADEEQPIVARMEQFINRQLSAENNIISMTPYDLAVVMGHEKVIQLLSQQSTPSFFHHKKRRLDDVTQPDKQDAPKEARTETFGATLTS